MVKIAIEVYRMLGMDDKLAALWLDAYSEW